MVMAFRSMSLRLRRVLVALVLIFGHTAATAVAAIPQCARTHTGQERPAEAAPLHGEQAEAAEPGTGERSAPVPHDHLPTAPAAAASAACGVVMLTSTGPDVVAPAVEQTTRAVPTDHAAPSSLSLPPPFQPPRA